MILESNTENPAVQAGSVSENTSPESVPTEKPPVTWASLGLSEKVLALIEKAGYRNPTPVQAESIPLVLEGNDVIGSAATGSGKTATFVLPTVDRFAGRQGTFVLALSPTREIAQQTASVFETFGGPLGLRSVVLIGGANMRLEEQALQSYPQIIVATPGRLCDHLERGNVWLEYIETLILDEADRMLDMGFADQLSKITSAIPNSRQTLMFSATFAPNVEALARKAMYEPKRVTIAKSSESAPKIDQRAFRIREEDKISALMRIFKEEPGTIIVFCRSKDRVSKLWRSLHSRCIYDATFIHSDRLQADREKAIADFKSGAHRILIATDVAGRGIDVDDVAHVVNFDLPMEAEDYVHRIGRTGRRGKTGIATTFVTDRDRDIVRRVERLIGKKLFGNGEGGESQGPTEPRSSSKPRNDRKDRSNGQAPRETVPSNGHKIQLSARASSSQPSREAGIQVSEGNHSPSEGGSQVAQGDRPPRDPNAPARRRRRRGGRGRRGGGGSGSNGAGAP